MQSLCYLDLPQLCLGTLYHPSVTRGDPLTAPKRPKTRPKPTDFPLFTFDIVCATESLIMSSYELVPHVRPNNTRYSFLQSYLDYLEYSLTFYF